MLRCWHLFTFPPEQWTPRPIPLFWCPDFPKSQIALQQAVQQWRRRDNAELDVKMAKWSIELSSMSQVNVKEIVMHILDLVRPDPDIHAFVSSCLKPADVHRDNVVVLLVITVRLLPKWGTGGKRSLGSFRCASFLTWYRGAHQRSTYYQEWMAPHPSCKCIRVRTRLHVLHNDSCVSGSWVKDIFSDERVFLQVDLGSTGCSFCTFTQRFRIHSACIFDHSDKQRDMLIAFEATSL